MNSQVEIKFVAVSVVLIFLSANLNIFVEKKLKPFASFSKVLAITK